MNRRPFHECGETTEKETTSVVTKQYSCRAQGNTILPYSMYVLGRLVSGTVPSDGWGLVFQCH